jgi:hypothetical protein
MHLATRVRTNFAGDFFMAAALLLATGLVVTLIVREMRAFSEGFPSSPPEAAQATNPTIPSDAVSVPSLVLGEGLRLAVGASIEAVSLLNGTAVLVRTSVEQGPTGPREIRLYDLSGTRFFVVLEPFERSGPKRVAGIYLQ